MMNNKGMMQPPKPKRGRKPGSTNAAPLTNPVPIKPKEKDDDLDIDNIDLESNEDQVEDDTVLIEEESEIDPSLDAGIKPADDVDEGY